MLEKLKAKLESRFPMSEEFWKEVELHAKKHVLKKNEVLIPYSSRLRTASIVISGSFRQSIIKSTGEQIAVWFFFEDLFDVIVCLDSFVLNEHTKYEIIALEDSIVYQFKKERADQWAEKFKDFSVFYREDILRTLFLTTEIRAQMTSITPAEFIHYLWKNYPEILDKIPSKYLAEFMGITPEWFSKLLNKKISND
ncbi:MAG: hypothetical protein AAF039_10795 [Bacteroidota bacterium]